MPRGDPFTEFCRRIAAVDRTIVADLHLHSTASDGDWTPSQVAVHASAAGLKAFALTDHDTFAGLNEAREALRQFPESRRPELVPGIELSAEFEGREVHILGLFVDPENADLREMAGRIVASRLGRFLGYVEQFQYLGATLDPGRVNAVLAGTSSPGRRHLAKLLVESGYAQSHFAAFQTYLNPSASAVQPKALPNLTDAVGAIHRAGGLAVLAHPSDEYGRDTFLRMHDLGLRGVESRFPAATLGRTDELGAWAKEWNWATTAGSDSHGPTRPLGSFGLAQDDWRELKSGRGRW